MRPALRYRPEAGAASGMNKRAHLRVVRPDETAALVHTSQRGVRWFLHRGTTKTGKPRYYVSKTPGEGALSAMPEGFDFSENINGVVSVRRVSSSRVPPADVELVEGALRRYPHLRAHQVEGAIRSIVVHEPLGAANPELAASLGISLAALELRRPHRFQPVVRFVPAGEGLYAVERMTYRGAGGWHRLGLGKLERVAGDVVPHIGTERFFELW